MKNLMVLIVSLAVIVAAGCGDGDSDIMVEPLCDDPAPILNKPDPDAPGIFVKLVDEAAVNSEILRLISTYDFTPEEIIEITNTFFAFLDDWTIELLRCDDSVEWMEWNAVKRPHLEGSRGQGFKDSSEGKGC